jgi:uncharacterized protein YukJ
MAIKRYGVVKAQAVDFKREDHDPTPHFQLFVEAHGTRFRVPVNVRSKLSPSELVYVVDPDFRHPITSGLPAFQEGYTRLPEPDRQGLDYIRGNLFDPERVIALPHHLPGQDNDLQDILVSQVQAAMTAGTHATVYVFGEPFPDQGGSASIQGIHDIHMNQGNHSDFKEDDGVYHDGGLIFHFPERQRFVAFFLAFQSQALHTDDQTGHALLGSRTFEDVVKKRGGEEPETHDVRVVGALINPEGGENQPTHKGRPESVILLNRTPDIVLLNGWALVDKNKERQNLDGLSIEAGGILKVSVAGSPMTLGNSGGTITLLDEEGLKVDGVSYTKEEGKQEGWTAVF